MKILLRFITFSLCCALVGTAAAQTATLFQKSADSAELMSGGIIRYTLRVRNTFDHPISDATILDKFDPAFFTVIDDGDAAVGGGELRWVLPPIDAGDSWQTSYSLRLKNGIKAGMVTNIATLSGEDVSEAPLSERLRIIETPIVHRLPESGAPLTSLLSAIIVGCSLSLAVVQKKIAA